MILTTCKIHGRLSSTQDVIKRIKNKNGHPSYRCKACYKQIKANNYAKNQTKIRERIKQYRLDNKDKVTAWKKTENAKRAVKRKAQREAKRLQTYFDKIEVVPEKIKPMKRKLIRILRKMRNLQHEYKSNLS